MLRIAIAFAAGAAFTSAAPVDVGAIQNEITAACGASPAIDIDWQSFDHDEDAMGAMSVSRLKFLSTAFADVCKDARLKPEVGKQIAKLVLSQAQGAADPVVYLTGGTLHVEYFWIKGNPPPDANYIAAEIASRLRGEEPEAP